MVGMSEGKPAANPLFLREEDLRRGLEMLFFAQRALAADAEAALARHGLGRAHHRALYFIGRSPGLSVTELLRILKVTKQTAGRVLADLTEAGLIEQRPAARDRRRRELRLTEAGRALEKELYDAQHARLLRAYRRAGAEAVAGFRRVAAGLLDEADRGLVESPLPERDRDRDR
ncbi:MAG: helix-turn-helix domain-containing protein [Azospirillaceae bacterium]